MGLSGLFRSVKRHPWLALGIFLASQLVTVAFWFVLPLQYKATASVLIPGSVSPGRSVRDDPRANAMGSKIALLQSRVVTDRVLQRLGLLTAEPLKLQWERIPEPRPAFEDWLATVISGGLLPEIKPQSFVLSVSYVSTNPDFATGLANAYALELVEAVNAINQRNDRGVGLASERVAKMTLQQMHDSQALVSKLGRQAGVIQEGLFDNQVTRFYAMSRLATINLRASLEQDSVVAAVAGMNDYGALLDDDFLKERRQTLAALEALQASNLESKGPRHPDSMRIKGVIDGVQRQIAAHQQKRQLMISSGAQIQSRSRTGTAQEGDEARNRLLASAADRLAYDRAIEHFGTLGDRYADMSAEAAVVELNNEVPKADMLVIQGASSPAHPWFPLLSYVVPLSLSLGLVCMLVACGIAASRYPAIASTKDLSEVVGVAAIGRLKVSGQKT